ncbi:FAD-binding protein [Roseivivax isoporae]|uniref:2-hydroxy-acid oxidase n=1 Tax=Roseivivax isoporae LMG 25204 TaxID=1449351 RepID=X7F6Q6_9RHOB|nr:FAD-binding protein [Roseivivax isoporae]ETX27764.1 2-hydroxy-acid oxidase [Roseivivax isoporae LMG 25204]
MRPESEEELSAIVAGARGPIRVRGGGTRGPGETAPGEVLETGGLSGIVLHEPGALTLVARAGTPLAGIEAALAAEGQRLAFEPPDLRGLLGTAGEPTIGGAVATNASGPRRIQAGACRDFLLGVRFVDGTGAVVRNGGRVMKNVTGYDLVKLMAGSRGTLGVLTEVALKVLPVPETEATLVLHGLPDAAAVAALATGLSAPYEVTGAAHLPGAGRTLLRIEGFAASVAYRADRLRALFPETAQEVEADPGASRALWAGVRDVAAFHGRAGDVWRLSVKPSDAPALAARLGAEALVYDWGGGLVWALLPEGTDARARLGAFAGHATLVRGSAATRAALPAFHPEPAPVAALSRGLRQRFDPRGVLNPGLMDA